MKSVHNFINHFYFVYFFIFIFINSVAFDTQPNVPSSSQKSNDSYECKNDNNECVASTSYNQKTKLSDILEKSENDTPLESNVCSDKSSSDNIKNDDINICSNNSELKINQNLRSDSNIGVQTDSDESDEVLKFKKDKSTQTLTGIINYSNLGIVKEPYEFNYSDQYIEGELLKEDDKYDIYPNSINNLGIYKIAEYKYNLNTCETISLNEPNGEIFLNDNDRYTMFKQPIEYVDTSKYYIPNDDLNKIQVPSNDINFIICDLNSLDNGKFDVRLKRTLTDLYGWVVIRPKINNGKNIIGGVIFGNIGVAINENIKSRIVSFTIHERQQIIKIEEFTSKTISRVVYFEQSKETISNKYFSTKKYNQLTIHNWYQLGRQVSFFSRGGITYHTLDFNSPTNYKNIFNVEVNNNETRYLPNINTNTFISNVIFGNVKVLFESNSMYRSVRTIFSGSTYFIEIFTIDSLGRKNHLLYSNKDSLSSNNVFNKIKYSRDGSIIYHQLGNLKEVYLIPVELNIPKMIFKGELWDVYKSISVCRCEENYMNDTIIADNLKFCLSCCGCKIDVNDKNPYKSTEDFSYINYSYKNFKQFGSIYISLNPKFIYTHRLGNIRIGNTAFPLTSLGYISSIKISKYRDNKVIIKFIVFEGGRYDYVDYMLQPDGESLKLVTKFSVHDLRPKWLSLWDYNQSELSVDLYLDKNGSGLIKSEYIQESNEVFYYGNGLVNISNVYWKSQLLSYPIIEDKKLIRRNVRLVFISNLRLVTIYSLYLTTTPHTKSKRIIFNISSKYKYWCIERQHFLENSAHVFERISDEYASSKLVGAEVVGGALYTDFDENDSRLDEIFEITRSRDSSYYKIKPAISSDVKIGNVKIGDLTIRQSGHYDVIGIWIQERMSFPYVTKNKWSNRKFSIFISDNFKVMVIEYGEIKKDNGVVEYLNLGPYPHLNDNIMIVITYTLDKYLNQIINLPLEDKMELVEDDMEYQCMTLVKLEVSKIFRSTSENFEGTELFNMICEFIQMLTREFIQEISSLYEDELGGDVKNYIYNAEINIRNKKIQSLTYI